MLSCSQYSTVVYNQCCCQGLETQGRGLENWSPRTRTFLEDNNTVNTGPSNKHPGLLEIQICQSTSHTLVTSQLPQHLPQHKVLTQIGLAYSVLENFRGRKLPRTTTRTWKLVLGDPQDKDFPRKQQHCLQLHDTLWSLHTVSSSCPLVRNRCCQILSLIAPCCTTCVTAEQPRTASGQSTPWYCLQSTSSEVFLYFVVEAAELAGGLCVIIKSTKFKQRLKTNTPTRNPDQTDQLI